MHGREVLEAVFREHRALHGCLRSWESALRDTRGTSYGECQQAVSVLRDMCRYCEHELQHHIREEEETLYAAAEVRLPRLQALVEELRHEHDIFRQTFDDFRRELQHFNNTGTLGRLPRLGTEVIGLMRQHMQREERELHPVVLHEFQDDDWKELQRLWARSRVA